MSTVAEALASAQATLAAVQAIPVVASDQQADLDAVNALNDSLNARFAIVIATAGDTTKTAQQRLDLVVATLGPQP